MASSNLNYGLIKVEKFLRINLCTISEDSDGYVANVIKPKRLILVTLARIAFSNISEILSIRIG